MSFSGPNHRVPWLERGILQAWSHIEVWISSIKTGILHDSLYFFGTCVKRAEMPVLSAALHAGMSVLHQR
jgi:hypothetical protein